VVRSHHWNFVAEPGAAAGASVRLGLVAGSVDGVTEPPVGEVREAVPGRAAAPGSEVARTDTAGTSPDGATPPDDTTVDGTGETATDGDAVAPLARPGIRTWPAKATATTATAAAPAVRKSLVR
jgi:hypothetical protein